MSGLHLFVASGDSCGICLGLAGCAVEEGYRPHDSCTCNTVPMDDGERECEYEFEIEEMWPSPNGFRVQLSLTVVCPDGTSHTVPGLSAELDRLLAGDNDDLLEDRAHEACDEECDTVDSPFLCC